MMIMVQYATLGGRNDPEYAVHGPDYVSLELRMWRL
jgi:hypothetical protein